VLFVKGSAQGQAEWGRFGWPGRVGFPRTVPRNAQARTQVGNLGPASPRAPPRARPAHRARGNRHRVSIPALVPSRRPQHDTDQATDRARSRYQDNRPSKGLPAPKCVRARGAGQELLAVLAALAVQLGEWGLILSPLAVGRIAHYRWLPNRICTRWPTGSSALTRWWPGRVTRSC